MRNILEYPITHKEMIDCLRYVAKKLCDRKPVIFGDMRPACLDRAADILCAGFLSDEEY